MSDADDPVFREATRLYLMDFVEMAGADTARDGGAVLASVLAEAARGMYYAVGTAVTIGVMEQILKQIRAEPHRDVLEGVRVDKAGLQ